MKLISSTVTVAQRNVVCFVAVLLVVLGVLQFTEAALQVEDASWLDPLIFTLFVLCALAVLRDWRFSRSAALILLCVSGMFVFLHLPIAVVGVTVPPVPARDFVMLAVTSVFAAAILWAVIWLWRDPPRKDV
jgi:hypothetical protein